jgi:hypothetical protein
MPCPKEKFKDKFNFKIINYHQVTTSMIQDYIKGDMLRMRWKLNWEKYKMPDCPFFSEN